MFPAYMADNHHEDQTVCAIYLSSVRKRCPWKLPNVLTVHSAQGQVRDEDFEEKEYDNVFPREGYGIPWGVSVEVTDVKTKDMVLCSLNWPVARRVGANAWKWSYTWMMSSRGKQNISLQCYITHHESCVKSPRSEIKAPWWVAIIRLLSDGTVTHMSIIMLQIYASKWTTCIRISV